MAEIKVMIINKNLDKLSFKERFLNLNAIIGNWDTINQDTTKITAYKNQTLMNRPFTNAILLFQNINGKEAINNPAAGMGTPLKPKLCFVSKLNLASLYAPAQGMMKAGNNKMIFVSNPSCCWA